MIHVVRHADAGHRSRWDGDDALRPLSPVGRAEATALVGRLADRVSAVLSSPHLRCVQTVQPVADAAGLELETADWLAEGAPFDLVLEEIGRLDDGTAVCSHGDVIGDLIGNLAARRVPLDGPLDWPKASIWHLEVEGGRIRRGSYEAPAPAASSPS